MGRNRRAGIVIAIVSTWSLVLGIKECASVLDEPDVALTEHVCASLGCYQKYHILGLLENQ